MLGMVDQLGRERKAGRLEKNEDTPSVAFLVLAAVWDEIGVNPGEKKKPNSYA